MDNKVIHFKTIKNFRLTYGYKIVGMMPYEKLAMRQKTSSGSHPRLYEIAYF